LDLLKCIYKPRLSMTSFKNDESLIVPNKFKYSRDFNQSSLLFNLPLNNTLK